MLNGVVGDAGSDPAHTISHPLIAASRQLSPHWSSVLRPGLDTGFDAVSEDACMRDNAHERGEDRNVEMRGIEPPTSLCKSEVFPLNDIPVRACGWACMITSQSRHPGYTVGIEPTFSGSQPVALPLGYVHHTNSVFKVILAEQSQPLYPTNF